MNKGKPKEPGEVREQDDNKDEGFPQQVPKFARLISSCFEPYMPIYLREEERIMNDKLERSKEDKDFFEDIKVLISSRKFFIYFKESLRRCSAITKGNTLFKLYRLYEKCLKAYADILLNKLPKAKEQMTLSLQSAFSAPGTGDQSSTLVYKLSDDDEVTTCIIINTCKFCTETIKPLEESIKLLIGEDIGKTVDMTSNQEDFTIVLTKAVRILVGGLETKMELPLSKMINIPWITCDSVGDQSEYVNIINFNINETVPIYREWLSPLYFTSFCNKFADVFITKFISAIYKCKRISQVGASQMRKLLRNVF